MNNRARVDGVVCSFRVPPYAPAELDEPLARLEDLGARHTKTKTDLRALEQERVNRIAENVQARVAALTAGKEPPADKAPKIEAEIEERKAAVQRSRDELGLAVDEVGNLVAQLVDQHRDAWLARLREHESETAAEFSDAVAKAQEAAAELGRARSGVSWLERFDLGEATVGQTVQWHGKGSTRVRGRSQTSLPNDYAVEELLELAGTFAETAERPLARVA